MTVKSGFFNSVNGDRRYDARWFAEYFATFIGNGVFPNPSTNLQVVEGTNMQTIVKVGKGWINGYYVTNDSDFILQHDIADGVLKRIDRVVLRLNYLTREIEIAVKKSALSSNPVAPTLQRDADAYELALADVLINNGAIVITQANITDQRLNTVLCGIVHGTVNQVDTTTLFNQYQSWFEQFTQQESTEFEEWRALEQSEFDAWFESVRDILDTNVAMDLQNQITALSNDYVKNPGIATTTNIGNDYSVTLNPAPTAYVEGMGLVLTINADSTDSVTFNVNGLGIVPAKKANGGSVSILSAGGVYTWRYSNGNFILQGEGGGGTAVASDLLSGKTAVSDAGDLIGTMPNIGAVTSNLNAGGSFTIPKGYHDGNGKVTTNSLASQTVADAVAANILSGKTAWVNGSKITGTIPSKGAQTFTPSTVNQTINSGQYLSGVQTILGDADLVAPNIVSGISILGVTGTAPLKKVTAGDVYNLTNVSKEGSGTFTKTLSTTFTRLTPNYRINARGSIRFYYGVNRPAEFAGQPNLEYQVYKNGQPFGIKRTLGYSSPTAYTEDLTCNDGDVFAIYGRSVSTFGLAVDTYGAQVSVINISSNENPYLLIIS